MLILVEFNFNMSFFIFYFFLFYIRKVLANKKNTLKKSRLSP